MALLKPEGGATQNTTVSNTTPVYGPEGQILGYEITLSTGDVQVLQPLEYENLLKYGTTDPKGAGLLGSTAAPRQPQPVFPDYAGAISATWKKYDAEIQANRMPFEDAIAAFNAEMDTITADMNAKIANQNSDIANQNTAVNAAQLTQGRDTQLINIASEQQNAITQANQQRGTAFANANSERTSRSGQLIDLLKRSTPASKGQMSVPLLGSGWGTVVKPDQFFDIQGLNNAIPVPVNQTVNWPTPSPVPTLPTVAPITSGPMPVAPAPPTNYPTTPNLDALLAGLLNPTPSGWY